MTPQLFVYNLKNCIFYINCILGICKKLLLVHVLKVQPFLIDSLNLLSINCKLQFIIELLTFHKTHFF